MRCVSDELFGRVAEVQTHAQCSEPFYKSAVADEIASDKGVDTEEKSKMMDLLRRFEEGHAEGPNIDDLDEGDEDELAAAMNGIDLGESAEEPL